MVILCSSDYHDVNVLLNIVSQGGDTVLLYSIKHDNYPKFTAILDAGADTEVKDSVSGLGH